MSFPNSSNPNPKVTHITHRIWAMFHRTYHAQHYWLNRGSVHHHYRWDIGLELFQLIILAISVFIDRSIQRSGVVCPSKSRACQRQIRPSRIRSKSVGSGQILIPSNSGKNSLTVENGPLQIHKIEHWLKTSHFVFLLKAKQKSYLSSNKDILVPPRSFQVMLVPMNLFWSYFSMNCYYLWFSRNIRHFYWKFSIIKKFFWVWKWFLVTTD